MTLTPPSDIRDDIDTIVAREPSHEVEAAKLVRRPGTASLRLTLGSLIRPALGAFVIAGLLMLTEAFATQLGPLLIQQGIDRGILGGDRAQVIRTAVLFLIAGVVGNAASSGRIWLTGRVALRLTTDLRVRLFTHLQRLPLSWLRGQRTGRLMARLTSDVDALMQLLQDGLANLAVQGLTLVVVTVILLRLHTGLALLLMFAVVPLMTWLSLWFKAASSEAHGTARERIADVLADLQENLLGARVITALGRGPRNALRHRDYVARYRDAELEIARVQSVYAPSVEAIAAGGQLVILAVGGALVIRDSLQVGELTAFLLYLGSFFAPIQQLVSFHSMYQRGMASTRKIGDILAVEPTVTEPVDARPLSVTSGTVTLEDVSFSYVPRVPVLRDVTLEIPGGTTVAIVGRTGAGKSTLARLLTRDFDPQRGRVLINGTDIRTATLASLRRAVLMVPQDAYVFRGTLANNLTLGMLEVEDERLREVCEQVGLASLLERVGGLHDPLARALSAGERQLIALARALLLDPAVLVLDESTSNLDLATQATVEVAMRATLVGRTSIVIAHRLSTALAADLVAVLADGEVVEYGTPGEVLARSNGAFAKMHADWVGHP